MKHRTSPPYTITIEQEQAEITLGPQRVLDPSWRWTDNAGHEHYVAKNGKPLPTLDWVVTATWWCQDCRDDHEEGEYRCRICGQAVQPGTRIDPGGSQFRPGRVSATLESNGKTWYVRAEELEKLQQAATSESRDLEARKIMQRQADTEVMNVLR